MKTFTIGGVHPAENKLSAAQPIRVAAIPKQAVFSMFQHIGAPAVPVVKKGDEVKVGTLLGEAGKGLSVPVFSSVSGKVNKVDAVLDSSGTPITYTITDAPAVVTLDIETNIVVNSETTGWASIGGEHIWLTHLTHNSSHEETAAYIQEHRSDFPGLASAKSILPAYDGLVLES